LGLLVGMYLDLLLIRVARGLPSTSAPTTATRPVAELVVARAPCRSTYRPRAARRSAPSGSSEARASIGGGFDRGGSSPTHPRGGASARRSPVGSTRSRWGAARSVLTKVATHNSGVSFKSNMRNNCEFGLSSRKCGRWDPKTGGGSVTNHKSGCLNKR
jgi:hypothetical protein